ncbi:MAG TPA: hypothetical protein VHY35_01340 [Stellaceae bacterium]|jgi:hypothetical protein|nr:hypothetical protein [Stellaceae bacterium]
MLDLNLAGHAVYPVAEELVLRGVPFVFVTGYAAQDLSREYMERPKLSKPFRRWDLKRIMAATFAPKGELT